MIRISNIKILINNKEDVIDDNNIIKIKKYIKDNYNISNISYFEINKRSIDSRNELYYVYSIIVSCDMEDKLIKKYNNIDKYIKKEYIIDNYGSNKLDKKIVIIGSGPSGLFCAYILSMYGFKPLIIEKGKCVEDRVSDVDKLFKYNKLNEDSNVCFGEGGAGTFSDGKLFSQTHDNIRIRKMLEIFVENGAPKDIIYNSHPHIGSDNLVKVIPNIRNKIIKLGGEFRFNSKLTNINVSNNEIKSIVINDSYEINNPLLILAIGHYSDDTYFMLNKVGIKLSNKNFAVGFRIMHDRCLIDKAMYHDKYNIMDSANYKLVCHNGDYGIYSFCMCPGGYVINSSTNNGYLRVNGMSNYKRNSLYSNSAIVVNVSEKDYGYNLFDGLNYQRSIEKKTFELENGLIPVQFFDDFKNNLINDIDNIELLGKYKSSNLRSIFSDNINKNIIFGIEYFNKIIPGFNSGILAGVESRTSSSIRINRDINYESNIKGIFPIGEGSGYSGGITSSCVDGMKMAEKIISFYDRQI